MICPRNDWMPIYRVDRNYGRSGGFIHYVLRFSHGSYRLTRSVVLSSGPWESYVSYGPYLP